MFLATCMVWWKQNDFHVSFYKYKYVYAYQILCRMLFWYVFLRRTVVFPYQTEDTVNRRTIKGIIG